MKIDQLVFLAMLVLGIAGWIGVCHNAQIEYREGRRSGGPDAFPPGWNAYRRLSAPMRGRWSRKHQGYYKDDVFIPPTHPDRHG